MKILLSDTSVLLNLLAGECLRNVSDGLGVKFMICSVVRAEAQYLRDAMTGELRPVDLGPLIESGLVEVVEIASEDEATSYLAEAAVVDDGEAMSIALAASRRFDLAIDDRRALNHVRRKFPDLALWTTPALLDEWSASQAVPPDRLAQVLRLIEARARYSPSPRDERHGWWRDRLAGA